MSAGTVAALATSIVVPILGLGWAILRYEAERYAAAHPGSRLVVDATKVIADARVIAKAAGVTPLGASTVLAGYLTDHGLPTTGEAIAADLAKVQGAVAADSSRLVAPGAK